MKKISFLLLLFISTLFANASEGDVFLLLKQNYKSSLLFEGQEDLIEILKTLPKEEYVSDQMVVELMERYPIENIWVEEYTSNITKDGAWSDIDYNSQDRSGWRAKIHVERILLLCRVYADKSHDYYRSPVVEAAIHKTLDFWFCTKPTSLNWWHNQIGVPKTLGAAVILFEDRLTEKEKKAAIEVLNNAKFGMTGQNKVWLAGNVLVRALLEEDYELVKDAQSQIFAEIKIGVDKKEGIKSDWSFHQHGAQQQFGNYGAAFLASTSFWAKVFSGTSLALSQEKLDLLSNLLTEGYQRVLWKGYLDVNGLGRQFFKQNQRHKGLSVMFSSRVLSQIDTQNSSSYEKLIKSNSLISDENMAQGLYHFWMSDQTVQRSANWMASLKMSSNRVIGAESLNGDNKQGYYIADGALYTYIEGDEYYNLGAAWDWRKIPGTTAYQTDLPLGNLGENKKNNLHDFVGNVSKDGYGLTAMRLDRDRLSANKTWLFTPNYILCIGTDIKTDSICDVITTVEQSQKKGDLLLLDDKQWKIIDRTHKLNSAEQRYLHNRIGYIVQGGDVVAKTEKRSGSWKDVMDLYPVTELSEKEITTIYLQHGQANAEKYQYVILPNVSQAEVSSFDTNNIEVDTTSANLIAVDLLAESKLFIASFISAVDYKHTSGLCIQTDEPCLLIVDHNKNGVEISLSDPSQKLDKITVTVNGKEKDVDLPTGEYRGTSISIVF